MQNALNLQLKYNSSIHCSNWSLLTFLLPVEPANLFTLTSTTSSVVQFISLPCFTSISDQILQLTSANDLPDLIISYHQPLNWKTVGQAKISREHANVGGFVDCSFWETSSTSMPT